MKRITGFLAAAAIAAFIAAGCGGGSDSANTSTTPSATSSTTVTAMANAAQWMSDSTVWIQGELAGTGTSLKSSEGSISCVGTVSNFTCVIWDDQGSATSTDHICNITGSYDNAAYAFDLEYDCYSFEPSTYALVDGNWTASVIYSGATTTASASKDVSVVKETGDACDIEEIANACGETYTFDGGSCTTTCNSASAACTATDASVTIDWEVGSRGINMTDECGTYVIAAGTSSTMAFCMPSNSQFIVSSTMNGTINGTAIDENMDVDCTMTY